MTVQLSTLRVQADLDASGYQRGAQAKVQADQAMIAAMNDNIARQAAYTDALAKNTSALEALRSQQDSVSAKIGSTAQAFGSLAEAAGKAGVAYLALSRVGLTSISGLAAANESYVAAAIAGSSRVASAANIMARAFGLISPVLSTLAAGLLGLKVGAEVIEKANGDFARMVELGRQAAALDVGANFVKQFEEAGKAIRATREEMDQALAQASKFTQPKFGQPDAVVDALSKLSQQGVLSSDSGARALAETATTTADKIRAAAEAMKELEASGNNLAAIDLGEKVFGQDVADRLRRGVTDAAALAESLSKSAETEVVDEAQVARSTALANEIERVKSEIRDAWSISLDFSSVSELIQTAWLGILNAANAVSQAIASIRVPQGLLDFLGKAGGGNPEELAQIGQAEQARMGAAVSRALGTNQVYGPPAPFRTGSEVLGPSASEVEKAGAAAKKAGGAAKEAADEWDNMVKRIEDSTRKVEEQVKTFGLGAAEVARYRAETELSTAAQRAGRDVTPEMTAQIKDLADKAGAAAGKLEALKKQQELISDLTSAGTSGFTSIVKDMGSGATAADAFKKALDGVADALTNIGKKSLDKSLTTGIQGLLKGNGLSGFSFDPVSLGIGAAGLALSFFTGDSQKKQQERQKNIDAWQKSQEDELAAIQKQQQAVIDAGIKSAEASARAAEDATRKAEAAARRIEGFTDRATRAGLDPNSLGGQLAALDLQQQREREQEVRDGGEALVALEAAQYAEREKLLRDFTEQALTEDKRRFDEAQAFLDNFSKTIKQFVDGLTAGSGSPLSPGDRLTQAQAQYNAQLALAQGGSRDALNGITGYASTLLDAGKAFYGSSAGYQGIFGTVTGQLTALPSQISPEQLIVNAIDSQTQSLGDILNQLDANGDGMISRQEAANTWLASLFNEIDVNGDGQITKLELIRFATAGTQTSVDSTNASVTASNTLLATEQSILNTMSGIMSAVSANTNATVSGIQNDIAQAQTLGTYTQKIVFNTASIAQHDGAPAQFSVGGWVNGPGTGTSDSIRAMLSNGEFVINAASAAVAGPLLERFNRGDFSLPAVPVPVGNDNSAAAEIRALRAEMADLKRALSAALDTVARTTEAGAEHVREAVVQVADSHTKLVTETKLQNARRAA